MDKSSIVNEKLEIIIKAEELGSYNAINQHLLEKRLRWYEENKDKLNLEGSDVRKAYTLVLLRYMNLNPNEVPVVHEDEKKIVWTSSNFCPVLEACKKLGLDTRKVCKAGWEQSVQAMVEKINPHLKFYRNYERLRPHGEYCEETIELLI